MASQRKAKGTRWESAVQDYANRVLDGLTKVYRPAQEGFRDVGDLHGLSPFIFQAKDWQSWQAAIREGLDGAVLQAAHAKEPFGAAVVKRARRPVSDAYHVMRLGDALAFYRSYLELQREVERLRIRLGSGEQE